MDDKLAKFLKTLFEFLRSEGIEVYSSPDVKCSSCVEFTYFDEFITFVKKCIGQGHPPIVFYCGGGLYYPIEGILVYAELSALYRDTFPKVRVLSFPKMIYYEDIGWKKLSWDKELCGISKKLYQMIKDLRKEFGGGDE